MAQLNLPYPNMDFVPLDILTAAEMNQMVANDQALADFANGLADGTNLSDGIVLARHIASSVVSADKIDFATIGDFSYSTSEVATNSKWIDGETIYRKVINLGALPNATNKDIPIGIAMSTVVNARIIASDGAITQVVPYATATSLAAQVGFAIYGTNTTSSSITVFSGTNRSGLTGWLILEYTK